MAISDIIKHDKLLEHIRKIKTEMEERSKNIAVELRCNEKTLEFIKDNNAGKQNNAYMSIGWGLPVKIDKNIEYGKIKAIRKNGTEEIIELKI